MNLPAILPSGPFFGGDISPSHRRPWIRASAFPFLSWAIPSLLLSACSPLETPFDTPEKALRDYHRALLLRDCKDAFSKLTAETQAMLTDKAGREAAKAEGAGLEAKAESMICQGDWAVYRSDSLSGDDVVEVRAVSASPDGTRATVIASYGGAEWSTELSRDADGKWRIDLTGTLADKIDGASPASPSGLAPTKADGGPAGEPQEKSTFHPTERAVEAPAASENPASSAVAPQ